MMNNPAMKNAMDKVGGDPPFTSRYINPAMKNAIGSPP